MSFWKGKHCVVTGASSGLGQAMAIQLARWGASVGLVSRRERELQDLASDLERQGHTAAYAVANVTQFDDTQTAVRQLENVLGPCAVLVANAGIYRKTDGAAYDAIRAAEVFSTNLIGVSHSIGTVLPGMVSRRGGHLCVISSVAGLLSLPASGAYCASKAALGVLMMSVQLDTHSHGIRVTTAFPGFIDTPMINDRERALPYVFSAEAAALRILHAVERGRREIYFPFRTWFECKLANRLPWPVYRRVLQMVSPLEEA
jgi:short-subunit dehydrogenase